MSGLTTKSVKDLLLEVSQHPNKYKQLMTCTCLTCSSVPHNQGSGQIGPKRGCIRDWSLIMGRGGLQNGKIAGPKLFAPPLKTG